jgi:Fe-S-cluster containining protein
MTTARTTRDVLWDSCRSKTCCRVTRVVLTGRDLVRLVCAFELEPSQFAMHIPTTAEHPPGFLLEPQGPGYELVLRKTGEIGPAGAPCVFLVETNDGHARCGAGASRPAVCEAYPATVSEGRARVVDGCCSCHRWSLLDLNADERELAWTADRESAEHAGAVEAWNAGVRERGASRSVEDYYRYLIETCR